MEWLRACHVKTVAMESTGVYWIPLFQKLEVAGLEERAMNENDGGGVATKST